MTDKENELLEHEPSPVLLKELTVRVLSREEFARAGRYFDEEHYLGDLSEGRCLLQVVEHKGRWVALLDWGASAHRLEDRDRWAGWTAQQRAERQGLVVMNRRFPLEGAVITADALHNSAPDAAAIVNASAHYLQVKQENRHSYQTTEKIAQSTPFLPTPKNPTPPTGALIAARPPSTP